MNWMWKGVLAGQVMLLIGVIAALVMDEWDKATFGMVSLIIGFQLLDEVKGEKE